MSQEKMRITKIPLLDLATHVQTDCQLSVRGTGMHPSAYMSTKVPFLEKNWPCSTSVHVGMLPTRWQS